MATCAAERESTGISRYGKEDYDGGTMSMILTLLSHNQEQQAFNIHHSRGS